MQLASIVYGTKQAQLKKIDLGEILPLPDLKNQLLAWLNPCNPNPKIIEEEIVMQVDLLMQEEKKSSVEYHDMLHQFTIPTKHLQKTIERGCIAGQKIQLKNRQVSWAKYLLTAFDFWLAINWIEKSYYAVNSEN
jgi:hypothetical protein